jgi:hypothetical protein
LLLHFPYHCYCISLIFVTAFPLSLLLHFPYHCYCISLMIVTV